jgi:multiple antibiotic resistance protein
MTYAETIKFLVAMTIMLNPLGSMSIFLQLTGGLSNNQQRKIAKTTTFAIITIMIVTLWIGNTLLELLGINIPAFRVAGGMILLMIGYSMLNSQESPLNYTPQDDEAAKERDSIAVVPLALPIIIGPGAITTLIVASGNFPEYSNQFLMSLICLFLGLVTGLMLYYSKTIAQLVGESVIKVVTRIMGMIIMAIAVSMWAQGLRGLFPMLG